MSNRDAQVQLDDLEEEEARIMRELRDLDEKAQAETAAKRRRQESLKEDPDTALSQLLLECEKEVRDAKGYIADNGPPLKIVRVRHGETAPKGATFLSRPKNTGVDFTVPLTAKAYTDVVKKPIFLNQMRDKMKAKMYTSSEDYLEDMRLLTRNTAAFNKGPELAWVVQHARFLLEAAEDAVTARRRFFYDVEDALRQHSVNKQKQSGTLAAVGKRKRSSGGAAMDNVNGDSKGLPNPGASIEVYWPNYRKWFAASIQARQGANVHVIYEEDSTDQWVNLDHGLKWRVKSARGAASAKPRRAQEPPASKKRKAGAASAHHDSAPVVVTGGVSIEDLDNVKTDVRSMLDELRNSVSDQMIRHVEQMDRTLHRSEHLQRVLLAVDDTRNDILTFMKKVDARCARMEEALLRPAGTSIKPTEKEIEETGTDGVEEKDIALNKETIEDRVVDATKKAQPPKGAVQDVIEIDDASTDKADDVQAVNAEQGATSKLAEAVNLEENERDVAILDKDVELPDSESRPSDRRAIADEVAAKVGSAEKAEVPTEQQVDAEGITAEAPLEGSAALPEPHGNARKTITGDLQDDGKRESVHKPEADTNHEESGADAIAHATEAEPNAINAGKDGIVENAGRDVSEEQVADKEVLEDEKPTTNDGTTMKESTKAASEESTQAGDKPAEKQVGEKGAIDSQPLMKSQDDGESSDGSEGSEDSDGSESESTSDGDEPKKGAKQPTDGKKKAVGSGGKTPLAAVERKVVPTEEDVEDVSDKAHGEAGAEKTDLRKSFKSGARDEKVIEVSSDGGPSGDGELAAKELKDGKGKGAKSG